MNEGHLTALVHQSVGVTPGLAVAPRGQVVFRAPGVCPAPPLWLWALCSCCFFPWCQGVVSCFCLVALRAVGCRVCCFVSNAPVGCFLSLRAAWGLVRVLPFLCCWSALTGRLSVLECAFWGFLLLFALLHPFPLLRVFVTSRKHKQKSATLQAVLPPKTSRRSAGRLLPKLHAGCPPV